MTDLFQGMGPDLVSPPTNLAVIAPSDATDLPFVTKAIYFGKAGNITITAMGQAGSPGVTLSNVPVGTVLSIRAQRVWATGTTASGLVALY
ncbi:MAG: hypothetical protein WDN46_08170 [Methylocella sp.]